ncbi:hypothetical protein NESM_000210800 [Novymonas esmeraldas]|uniref:Uncharacterized protein n=1 Tax=Novymonas esmeraldas TaxID=1808958 RepID=A0AAW0FAE0_9TRYP
MDNGRRREVRSARRLRRHQRDADDGDEGNARRTGSAAGSGRTASPAAGTGAAMSSGAGGRRSTAVATRDEAQRLSERMQQQRQVKSRADQVLSQRETSIRERYAPNAMNATAAATRGQPQQQPPPPQSSAYAFDRDDLLAELIGDSKANFLKLDHDLTEDHTIATQRLHTSVFTHANSFLLLFRDVDRASDLVEALKANVQGTKAAISSISKYASANIVGGGGRAAGKPPSGAAAAAGAGSSVFSTTISGAAGDGDPRRLARPSLVSRRVAQRDTSSSGAAWLSEVGGGPGRDGRRGGGADASAAAAATSMRATTWASTVQRSGAAEEDGEGGGVGGGGGVGADVVAATTGASRSTTRGLNVTSVRQWRHTIGMGAVLAAARVGRNEGGNDGNGGGNGRPAVPGRRLRGGGVGGGGAADGAASAPTTAAAKWEREATETAAFVDILREEVHQLLAERRHADAAELLYRLADEATAKGCVPLLLDLEAALVNSVVTNVIKVPVTPAYVESLHVPLMQLLLRFGRSRSAAAVFLAMHTPWLHSEVQRLQSRVNPQCASLIAVDFLVRATRATVRRQHTLGLALAAARPFMGDTGAGTPDAAAAAAAKSDGKERPTAAANRATVTTRKSSSAGAAAAPPGTLIPPNSATLLWVRRNVERVACDVLATHLLSFGTGSDGGDPTRIRQAAQMMAQASRVMQVLSTDGFAGCETLILRQLTPSLVVLEADFTRLTGERLEHGGRAMVEQLVTGSLAFYEAHLSNTAAIAAVATATAKYAAAVAAASAAPPPPTAAAGAKGGQATTPSPPPMPPRPSPPRLAHPYQPSRCDDVARKVRVRCQELVQLIRTLPLSGHSLLIQLLLAPASSSLFKQAAPAGAGASPPASVMQRRGSGPGAGADGAVTVRTGGRQASAALGKAAASTAAAVSASAALATAMYTAPPPPPLPSERYRFLRYANGCSTTHVSLLRSLCGYVAALTGTDQLPAEVIAAALVQEQEAASSVTAATAMRQQQAECVAVLLTNAMVTESIDVVLCNLLTRTMTALLRQRRALVRFLCSDAFLTNHRRVFPAAAAAAKATSDTPFFSDPATSPAWVLESMLSLLSDVLGLGSWLSFFTRGGAMRHMLADVHFSFRTQHLERVQWEAPRLVQGWMCAALLLGADVTRAGSVLAPPAAAARAAAPSVGSSAATPLLAPQQSVQFGSPPPDRGDSRSPTLGSKSHVSFSAVSAAVASAAAAAGASATKRSNKASAEASAALVCIPVSSPSSAEGGGQKDGAAVGSSFADAGVREERLLKLLMSFLDRRYRTPVGYTVHRYVVDSATATTATTTSDDSGGGGGAGLSGVWAVRAQLRSYPEFPIGEMREHRGDEVFLFHWCVQVSLHLLTFFQERLVTPSFATNQRAAEAQGGMASFLNSGHPFPVHGCITPQEDTVLAGWCAGGGNYVTAVALLQFLVMRLLRDGLCRVDTWSAVYGCPATQWRSDEAVLRQQLFFFALFAHLWAPLFTGGRTVRARATGTARAAAATATTAGASPAKEEAPVSSFMVDGLPPLAVLEWMTCGGVLDSSANADSVAAALAAAPLATIPAHLTAIDVLFATEGTIYLSPGGGDGSGVAGGTGAAPAAAGVASWKAKAGGGGGAGSAAAAAPTGASAASPSSISTNATLAKRELFGAGASYVPDGPLRVLRHFFEEQLGESRAIPAITSDAMRTRVERAMAEINLLDFVGTSLGADDDEESDGDASSSTVTASSAGAGSADRKPSPKVTLQRVRDLISVYAVPLS